MVFPGQATIIRARICDPDPRLVVLTKEPGQRLGVQLGRSLVVGLTVVESVPPPSAAFGLVSPSDILLEVNGEAVLSPEHGAALLKEAEQVHLRLRPAGRCGLAAVLTTGVCLLALAAGATKHAVVLDYELDVALPPPSPLRVRAPTRRHSKQPQGKPAGTGNQFRTVMVKPVQNRPCATASPDSRTPATRMRSALAPRSFPRNSTSSNASHDFKRGGSARQPSHAQPRASHSQARVTQHVRSAQPARSMQQPAKSTAERSASEEDGIMEKVRWAYTTKNACATYTTNTSDSIRSNAATDWAVRPQLISRTNERVLVNGYNEYFMNLFKITQLRPERMSDQLDSCPRMRLAVGIPFSTNNIWHQLHHAVFAWTSARRELGSSIGDDDDIAVLPLIWTLPSSMKGKVKGDPPSWHAWEFSIRAFTSLPHAQILGQTASLMAARCTCFDSLHIAAGPFDPVDATDLARSMMWDFRQATLKRAVPLALAQNGLSGSMRVLPSGEVSTRVLYIRRAAGSGTGALKFKQRFAVNDADVTSSLKALGGKPLQDGGRLDVSAVVVEQLPLVQQMYLMSNTHVVVTAHGQAMTWMTFMPWRERKVGIIEMLPEKLRVVAYAELAEALHILYRRHHVHIADTSAQARRCRDLWVTLCGNTPQRIDVDTLVRDVQSMVQAVLPD